MNPSVSRVQTEPLLHASTHDSVGGHGKMADTEDHVLEPATPAAPLSFCFLRTSRPRQLAGQGDAAGLAPEEKDFLKTMERRELQNPPEGPKELVIPLIQNGYRRQPLAQSPGPFTEALADTALSQAVKELTEESKMSLVERKGAGADAVLTIPVAQTGCTPGGKRGDSQSWAETVPDADYEAVPVEAYGLAMLRGMGWKPGEGIGRTFNEVVKPCVTSLRLKGLGLGANLTQAQVQAVASSGCYHPPRPDGEQEKDKEDQTQGLVPGDTVVVLSGPYQHLYGKVEGLDPDNVRAMVRLAVGRHTVTISGYCLRPVSQQEFDANSLRLVQASRTCSRQHSGTALSQKALRNEDLHDPQEDSGRKRKHFPDRQEGPAAKRGTAARSRHWLTRDLRVRFVDKLYEAGRYYNTKMTIEDVLSPDTCTCRTDEGRVLEGVREDMLETLVPKGEGDRVMVVLGPQAGKVGYLLGRDTARSRALVHLRRDNHLVELHYNAVCQFIGLSDSDDD
ncbi:PREDICTED: G patch domain and KOW motifs-containing protein-like [Chinchilla lanigera]|uniref:G-patch domain and KOW motifs-containing protein n=1 Tax=Chinchilla lanigera TaxID=34839 RepID=A0A8C2V542_CHILA|nr:PREDICTED: G patch domain and KOW motifs-containing protein-like [Chinchilla lanigera]